MYIHVFSSEDDNIVNKSNFDQAVDEMQAYGYKVRKVRFSEFSSLQYQSFHSSNKLKVFRQQISIRWCHWTNSDFIYWLGQYFWRNEGKMTSDITLLVLCKLYTQPILCDILHGKSKLEITARYRGDMKLRSKLKTAAFGKMIRFFDHDKLSRVYINLFQLRKL